MIKALKASSLTLSCASLAFSRHGLRPTSSTAARSRSTSSSIATRNRDRDASSVSRPSGPLFCTHPATTVATEAAMQGLDPISSDGILLLHHEHQGGPDPAAAGRNPHRSCDRRDHAGRQGPTGWSRWGDWRREMDGCVVIAFKSVLLLLVNPVQNFFACLIDHRSVILSWIPGHFD